MSTHAPTSVKIVSLPLRAEISDVEGLRVQRQALQDLGIDTGRVRHAKVFAFAWPIDDAQMQRFADEALADAVLHDVTLGRFPNVAGFSRALLLRRLPGVTDDEGASAQDALCAWLGQDSEAMQRAFSQEHYLIEKPLDADSLQRLARDLLGNPLVHDFEHGRPEDISVRAPIVQLLASDQVDSIDLEIDDNHLVQLSRQRVLSLNLTEMRSIRDH